MRVAVVPLCAALVVSAACVAAQSTDPRDSLGRHFSDVPPDKRGITLELIARLDMASRWTRLESPRQWRDVCHDARIGPLV